MAKTHTPGPWKIHRNEFCQWIGNENGKAQLAKVFHPAGMSDETAEANAQLIASAPELLAALQSAQMALMGFTNPNDVVRKALFQAAKAIAKAKGGE